MTRIARQRRHNANAWIGTINMLAMATCVFVLATSVLNPPSVGNGQAPAELQATARQTVELQAAKRQTQAATSTTGVPANDTSSAIERPTAAAQLTEIAHTAARRTRTFNGRAIVPVDVVTMRVTAYSPDARSCGQFADGITASGYSVWTNGMKLVAADTALLPFGSVVSIPGYHNDRPVPVLDRGGVIEGARLDVLMPSHAEAMQWGVKHIPVTIWAYADEHDRQAHNQLAASNQRDTLTSITEGGSNQYP